MNQDGRRRRVVIGVDTHKYVHVAVALDELGTPLGDTAMPADRAGYDRLLAWASEQGKIIAFGIEGTGSYGAGFTSLVRRRGHKVIEVVRQDRRERRLNGKSDLLDAHNAARAVLAGTAKATPKSADGIVEMIQIKVAMPRDFELDVDRRPSRSSVFNQKLSEREIPVSAPRALTSTRGTRGTRRGGASVCR